MSKEPCVLSTGRKCSIDATDPPTALLAVHRRGSVLFFGSGLFPTLWFVGHSQCRRFAPPLDVNDLGNGCVTTNTRNTRRMFNDKRSK